MSIKKAIRLLCGTGSKVNIDGRSFSGRNVTVVNNEVWVDGVRQDGTLTGPVSITVHGSVESIDGPATQVSVSGDVGSVETMSGSVKCGNVSGDVQTMSGDVTCGSVGGRVSTLSGDIRQ